MLLTKGFSPKSADNKEYNHILGFVVREIPS